MLETAAYVSFVVPAIGILLLKNWAVGRWPRDDDESEPDGDAPSEGGS